MSLHDREACCAPGKGPLGARPASRTITEGNAACLHRPKAFKVDRKSALTSASCPHLQLGSLPHPNCGEQKTAVCISFFEPSSSCFSSSWSPIKSDRLWNGDQISLQKGSVLPNDTVKMGVFFHKSVSLLISSLYSRSLSTSLG